MSSTCSISVNDGTLTVLMQNIPENEIAFGNVSGGGALLRFLDGAGKPQRRWRKKTITISGQDYKPAGLDALDFDQTLTVEVTTGLGTDTYQCMSLGPSEDWNLNGGTVNWTMLLEEI